MIFNISYKSAVSPKIGRDSAIVMYNFDGSSPFSEVLAKFDVELSGDLDKKFGGKDSPEFSGFVNEPAPVLLGVKNIKFDKKFSTDFFRNHLSKVISELKPNSVKNLFVIIPKFEAFEKYFINEEQYLKSFIEGIQLGNYSFDIYKTEKKKRENLSVTFIYDGKNLRKHIKECAASYMGVELARDLANEPSNKLTPAEYVKRIRKSFRGKNVKLTVWNKAELEKRKMAAILAVGGSSENPPFLVKMHYKPTNKSKAKVVLVGKGITFDTGGYSLKPSDSMLEMKADMAGSAAVVGAVLAASENNLPVEVIGITPLAENVVSGGAYKPSDIINSFAGKTIEINNTDAEGRLILADALAYASTLKPDCIVDFATLTGACYVALGDLAAGLFTNSDMLADKLSSAGNFAFERLWRLPIWEEYFEGIKSDIADIENTGPRWGGAITAAKFLEFFVNEKVDWAHLDIAGPAIKNKSTNYTKKYNTGFGVRLAYQFLKDY